MQLRVLGAHNMESKDTRMECHLIDGVLALDAGSLARALSFEEQRGVRAVLLSHRHFDHIKDLLPLGLTFWNTGLTVDVYGIKDTIDYVASRLMDGELYPDFLNLPTPENPVFRLHTVEVLREFQVLDYTVMAVPVPHDVPAVGFQISNSGGPRLFYTGDTGPGLVDAWEHVAPEVLLTEVTFGNDDEARAVLVGHLTPRFLEDALIAFKDQRGYLPKVIVTHLNPPWEAIIRRELEPIAAKLGFDLTVSRADMEFAI
jgi:ribonuclease BN (tRNA processing enzyme)